MQEIRNGKKSVLHLCLECAGKKALPHGGLLDGLDLADIMKAFETELEKRSDAEEQAEKDPWGPCPVCMWKAADIMKTGLFGCPECYTHFKDLVAEKLLELNNAKIHTGRVPDYSGDLFHREEDDGIRSLAGKQADSDALAHRIAELKQDIEGSIRREEYELAAKLRDQLRQLLTETR